MKKRIQEWLRRWTIRQLIKLVDRAEERLQMWQVQLRKDLSNGALDHRADVVGVPDLPVDRPLPRQESQKESFVEWEKRKSGVAPISKKAARKHRERLTAAAFDLRYAR